MRHHRYHSHRDRSCLVSMYCTIVLNLCHSNSGLTLTPPSIAAPKRYHRAQNNIGRRWWEDDGMMISGRSSNRNQKRSSSPSCIILLRSMMDSSSDEKDEEEDFKNDPISISPSKSKSVKNANKSMTKRPSNRRTLKPATKSSKLLKMKKSTTSTSTTSTSTSTKSKKRRSRRNSNNNNDTSGAWYQRGEMLNHEILTKEEELALGHDLQTAKKLRQKMILLVEEKRLAFVQDQSPHFKELYYADISNYYDNNNDDEEDDEISEQNGFSIIDTTAATPSSSISSMNSNNNDPSVLVKDASDLNPAAIEADLRVLTEDDIINHLHISGGHDELRQILSKGIHARTTFLRCNIRLVVSTAKRWIKQSHSTTTSSSSSSSSSSETFLLANIYNGGWGRPSLDEVIQEGMIGLTRAVDKFDPTRGLRFSTYSSHWITSYIRRIIQVSTTGCLRVPTQLHQIKSSYRALLKRYYDMAEPVPSIELIAAELGITVNRLRSAVTVTENLLSIDQPVYMGNVMYKGSGSGGDGGDGEALIADILTSDETTPEDHVDLSFLRQSLENAMAAELSPHERDVLRLRLGLDDGQTRTVKEVVEVCGGHLRDADIRTTERRAFKKLRSHNSIQSHDLASYLYMIGC